MIFRKVTAPVREVYEWPSYTYVKLCCFYFQSYNAPCVTQGPYHRLNNSIDVLFTRCISMFTCNVCCFLPHSNVLCPCLSVPVSAARRKRCSQCCPRLNGSESTVVFCPLRRSITFYMCSIIFCWDGGRDRVLYYLILH